MNLAFEVFSISPTVSPAVVVQHNITLSLVVMLKNLIRFLRPQHKKNKKNSKILFYPKFIYHPPQKKKKEKKVDTMGTYNSVIRFFDFLNIRSPTIWHSKICFGVVWRAATLALQV